MVALDKKAEVRHTFPSNTPHQSLWDQAAAKRIRFLKNLSSTDTFKSLEKTQTKTFPTQILQTVLL